MKKCLFAISTVIIVSFFVSGTAVAGKSLKVTDCKGNTIQIQPAYIGGVWVPLGEGVLQYPWEKVKSILLDCKGMTDSKYSAQISLKDGKVDKNSFINGFYWTTGGGTPDLKGKTEYGVEYVIHISKIKEISVTD